MTTPVIFRKYPDGDIIALFPTTPATVSNWHLCQSYMHIGQHGAANTNIVSHDTVLAQPTEYAGLLAELKSYGDGTVYDDLVVYERMQPWMTRERERAWKEIMK